MIDNLPKNVSNGFAKRILLGLGNLIVTQSEKVSDKVISHQKKLADIEVYKSNAIALNQSNIDLRQQLFEKLITANPEEKLRIRQDINFLEGDINQTQTYIKAVEYASNSLQPMSDEPTSESENETTRAWLDTFNEYARKQNEGWRADLLSKALAREAANPGSIGQRGLWLIGTIEQDAFNAFAAILDHCMKLGDSPLLPAISNSSIFDKTISYDYFERDFTLGKLIFVLSDLGLIGNVASSHIIIPKENLVTFKYDTKEAKFKAKEAVKIKGIILTKLGYKIAELYEPTPQSLGKAHFEDFVQTLQQNNDWEQI